MKLTTNIKNYYQNLWNTCEIPQEHKMTCKMILSKILNNKKRYLAVAKEAKVPWSFIAVIHNMEASLSFAKHFHNGDSLNHRTKHVPKGRPLSEPPFTWEESTIDALKFKKLNHINWNDITTVLFQLERYNGWGYRKYHSDINSPYLWSMSNHYTKGKYIKDGIFSPDAVSKQCGTAILLKIIDNRELINL